MTPLRRRPRPAGPRLFLAGSVLLLALFGAGVAGPAAATPPAGGPACWAGLSTAGCR
ncbi:hypothetical protein [Pseudonocardia spirodelae]|uniref:Uncharacterized protein n=1 Tax=Pseudonocardia spirodelae TaxID=3133431 RepID=A0ABU8T993_9PSEU